MLLKKRFPKNVGSRKTSSRCEWGVVAWLVVGTTFPRVDDIRLSYEATWEDMGRVEETKEAEI